jgi:hypothetical protein
LGVVVCPFKPAECRAPALATPGIPLFVLILRNSSCKAMLTLIKTLIRRHEGSGKALLRRFCGTINAPHTLKRKENKGRMDAGGQRPSRPHRPRRSLQTPFNTLKTTDKSLKRTLKEP